MLPTFRDWTLLLDADLRDLTALKSLLGLEPSVEKSKLSLLLQYSSFIECTAWRYVALAAVSASLASDRFGSREFCEEDERAFTRLEHSSSLDLADLVSILCFGLILIPRA